MNATPPAPRLLSPSELSAALGGRPGHRTLWRLLSGNKLPAVNMGDEKRGQWFAAETLPPLILKHGMPAAKAMHARGMLEKLMNPERRASA